MKTLIFALLVCSPLNDNYIESAARLLSVGEVEELSSVQLEHIENLHDHPLLINFASRSELLETCFLSEFQAASILDYIGRNGQILSPAEFAAVPGIGPARAEDLAHFIAFTHYSLAETPRRRTGKKPEAEITMYNSVRSTKTGQLESANKKKSDLTAGSGLKAMIGYENLKYGKEISAGLGAKEKINSYYISFKGKRFIDKAIVGSYNARWGQGLTTWTGFSMTGLGSVAGFSRNASGVGASGTLSEGSALQGAAIAASCGRSGLQAFWAAGQAAAANLKHYTSNSTIGLTTMVNWQKDLYGTISADTKATFGKFTGFAETAIQIKSSGINYGAIGGVLWNIDYKKRAGLQLRFYSPEFEPGLGGASKLGGKCSDEIGGALGIEWNDFNWITEGAFKTQSETQKLRSTANYNINIKTTEMRFRYKLKWNSEDKGPQHEVSIEFRTDSQKAIYGAAKTILGISSEQELGWLCYTDAGLVKSGSSIYFRTLYFNTPSWNSRIYAYGRDIPGSFSVPAYYGKGIEFSLIARCRYIAAKLCYIHSCIPPVKSRPKTEIRDRIEFKLYLKFK